MATNTATNGENPWDKKELGALWKREKQTSKEKYLTGVLNLKNLGDEFPDKDVPVVIFSNKRKQKDTHPDLRVYLSEKNSKPATTTAKPTVNRVAAPAPETTQDANELI